MCLLTVLTIGLVLRVFFFLSIIGFVGQLHSVPRMTW